MTFDADKVVATDLACDYQDYSYDWNLTVLRHRDQTTTTFSFDDGTTLTIRNAEYTLTTKVELIEGRMYQLGRDGKKWLALCRFDEEYSQLTLFPTDRRKKAPIVKNEDRMDYHFYREFEHNYKAYL